jgi:hypothetical protein
MRQIKNNRTIFCDVDGTLVVHTNDTIQDYIAVPDCVNLGKYVKVIPHWNNIRILKEEHVRGAFVVVWSKGGNQWAADVIVTLGLESYVDIIMDKPTAYIDDLPIEVWCPDRIFIPIDSAYKIIEDNQGGSNE